MRLRIASLVLMIGLYSLHANSDTRVFNYKDGSTRATTNYLNDKRHGIETWFFRTGEVRSEVNYVSGLKQGFKIIYNKKGDVLKKRHYRDNFPISMPSTFTDSKNEICSAKLYQAVNDTTKFNDCSGSLDALFSEFSNNPGLLPVINSIKDFYLSLR